MALNRNSICVAQLFPNEITLKIFDEVTHQSSPYRFPCDLNDETNMQQFFDLLSSELELDKIKAMAFSMMDVYFRNFTTAYKFRQKAYEFCNSHGIFYCLESEISVRMAAAIAQTKTMVNFNEKIMVIKTTRHGWISGGIFIREKDNYREMTVSFPETPKFTQEWKNNFLGHHVIRRVIIIREEYDSMEYVNELKEFFKAENSIIYNENLDLNAYYDGFVLRVSHHMGERVNPYHVSNHYLNSLMVKIDNDLIIASTPDQTLPFESYCILFDKPFKTVKLISHEPFEVIKEAEISSFKCKKVKVILKIDKNAFYDFKIEPFYDNNLDEKLSEMKIADSVSPDKAKIIFDQESFTVFLTAKGKQYIVENKDGAYSTPIFIAFTAKKPLFGLTAQEMYDKKPKFVVYDIMKLCSLSDATFLNPDWRFKLVKEESIMVSMDTVDGEKKSSVEFLLALILKNGLQTIKNENGMKMDEIEIGFVDGFIPNEILKKNFEKAAALINLKIVFV